MQQKKEWKDRLFRIDPTKSGDNRSGRGSGRGNNDRGGSGGDGGDNNKKGGMPPRQNLFFMGLATLVLMLIISYFMQSMRGTVNREISYNRFVELIEAGELEEVIMAADRIEITPKEGVVINLEDETAAQSAQPPSPVFRGQPVTYYTGKIEDDDTLTARLLEHGVKVSGSVPDTTAMVLSFLLTYVLPIVLMWALLSLLFRRMGARGGPMGVGAARPRNMCCGRPA